MWISILFSVSLAAQQQETLVLGANTAGCVTARNAKSRPTGPGAGMDPAAIEPHVSIYKDGFFHVTCAQDIMENNGDKFGSSSQRYTDDEAFTAYGNVSIVRYEEHVERDSRKSMTPKVCFDFCRTVPDMLFFGLLHGRDCYCTPYFVAADKGGKGVCDWGCEGDLNSICGGEFKSSMYEMHLCANTAEDLTATSTAVAAEQLAIGEASAGGLALAAALEATAETLMGLAIDNSDMLAHANGQEAKVMAGELKHAAERAAESSSALTESKTAIDGMAGEDMTDADNVYSAEEAMTHAHDTMDEAKHTMEEISEVSASVKPHFGENGTWGATGMFNSILYAFEDTKVANANSAVPTSCEGVYVGKPMTNMSFAECAEACNSFAPKSSLDYCIAYQYYDMGAQSDGLQHSLCLMYRELGKVDYFDCEAERAEKPEFLQTKKKRSFTHVGCYGRMDYMDSAPKVEHEQRTGCWGI